MEVIKTIMALRSKLAKHRLKGNKIGLVPTMGALHNGHLALVNASKNQCEITVVSIFVNPAQFNNAEDLEKYPNTIEKDTALLKAAGCNFLFLPSVKEIYPNTHDLSISFGALENNLEGRFRPGHFQGVGLVVSKLFNICQPDYAFFGQKDLQQFFVINKLIDQLSFPIDLKMVETSREENGLAMSSRNLRLSERDKSEASLINQSLSIAKKQLLEGVGIKTVIENAKELFATNDRFTLEYFEIVETDNFSSLTQVTNPKKTAICVAAYIGKVRLIDNLFLNY
ncbi:MAG: pantoate--beta-alanine ligase [Cytophagales bacterium CG12_big_fil_rev_8_21_14_0_65_40_12]|nr:MAG: pantoate--beta-alanine ligase [Cytophagales bacterium CG12_big_fil_rev_8_21_14_0_65_40_12]PIW03056.1 MAG: pantoate--beta-alanine ligase [Cytophagales bacterium CG17_big_fil_post_rev_8_21_14_2_50_40_13]